jgi:hypothetical protein
MKSNLMIVTLLAAMPAFFSNAHAVNFGGAAAPAKPGTATVSATTVKAAAITTPQVTGQFRIVKPDGSTLIAQAAISTNGPLNVINVATTDAFLTSGGKCAFNVKYDEYSPASVTGTTNRLYDNDTLIAQNTKIDVVANVVKTIWTQPYLVPGANNVKIVVNADSATPSTGWVRVNVSGNCGAAEKPPVTTTPPPAPPPPAVTPPAPPKPPVAPVFYAPGSAEWNNLFNAFGYSNYGVTQLKGKGYARYTELVKLNADITVVINAKKVDRDTYNALIARWNSFVNDKAFKDAMAKIVPGTPGKS